MELTLLNSNSFEMEQKLLKIEVNIALVENETSHSDITYIDFMHDEIIAVTVSTSIYSKTKKHTP